MDLSLVVGIKSPSVTNFVVSVNGVGVRFGGLGGLMDLAVSCKDLLTEVKKEARKKEQAETAEWPD